MSIFSKCLVFLVVFALVAPPQPIVGQPLLRTYLPFSSHSFVKSAIFVIWLILEMNKNLLTENEKVVRGGTLS